MPIIFYGLLAVLFLISFRFKKQDGFLDKNSSNVIKGLFILLIVFSHILNAFPYGGFMATPLAWFRAILGQLCVSMFFFISGYGIIFSIEANGNKYSKSMITNRFLRILICTIIGLIPLFIYSACLGKWHPIDDYFLALVGLASFGNPSWFLFAILVCYLVCSIVYIFNWKNKYIPVILVSIGVITYILMMYFFKQPNSRWDTAVSFIYGMVAALFRKKINILLNKKRYIPYVFMVISLGLVVLLQWVISSRYASYFPEIIEMWFANAFFCAFFVCLTKVFTLKSTVLSYLGKASFAIFIMHMFVICCFVDIGTIPQAWLNYLVLFVTSPLIGIPVFYIYKVTDKYITNRIVNWNRNIVERKTI